MSSEIPVTDLLTDSERQDPPRCFCSTRICFLNIVRTSALSFPVFMAINAYVQSAGVPVFIRNVNERAIFYSITLAVVLAVFLFIYVPCIILADIKRKTAKDKYGWRPPMLVYLCVCTLPCMVLNMVAINAETTIRETLTSPIIISDGAIIAGFMTTEWLLKWTEEAFSYDVIMFMAHDFLFAYDVNALLVMGGLMGALASPWLYVTAFSGFLACCRYLLVYTTGIRRRKDTERRARYILVSLFLHEMPFLVLRVTMMCMYGIYVCNPLYPFKNLAMLILGSVQINMLWSPNYNHILAGRHDRDSITVMVTPVLR